MHAREERPPPKAEALEWFVLTTLPVTSTADAQRVLRGTRFAGASRTTSASSNPGARSRSCSTTPPSGSNVAIAIKMVVGWRIQLMVRLGREVPELPSELLFSDGELRVLATFARSREALAP